MKLNLGCGKDYIEGYVNVDSNTNLKVDLIVDLNKYPYPFEDNSAEEIFASEVLEHLDDVIKTMQELWRICKSEGKIIIKVPYYKWAGAFWDPTHKHFFHERSFDYFRPESTFYIPGYPKFQVFSIKFIGGKLRKWEKRHMIVELKPKK